MGTYNLRVKKTAGVYRDCGTPRTIQLTTKREIQDSDRELKEVVLEIAEILAQQILPKMNRRILKTLSRCGISITDEDLAIAMILGVDIIVTRGRGTSIVADLACPSVVVSKILSERISIEIAAALGNQKEKMFMGDTMFSFN